jgi:hypothetical protein
MTIEYLGILLMAVVFVVYAKGCIRETLNEKFEELRLYPTIAIGP